MFAPRAGINHRGGSDMKTISREALRKKIERGVDIQLVDVRGKECCYDLGHIPGAISMPLNEVMTRAKKELKKEGPVIVYCGGFSCTLSPRAAEMLTVQLGFKDVSHYEGGINDWRDAGLPVEK